jgi:hypothetical protein
MTITAKKSPEVQRPNPKAPMRKMTAIGKAAKKLTSATARPRFQVIPQRAEHEATDDASSELTGDDRRIGHAIAREHLGAENDSSNRGEDNKAGGKAESTRHAVC